jgi:hypothetical protein
MRRLWILALLAMAGSVWVQAAVKRQDRTLDKVPGDSYKLKGIVDESSKFFACHIGRYTAKRTGSNLVSFQGGGLLINSAWLHKRVLANPGIQYRLSPGADIRDGSKLSVFCIGSGPDKDQHPLIEFYVLNQ